MNEWVLGFCAFAGVMMGMVMWQQWRDRRAMREYRRVMRCMAYAWLHTPTAAAIREMAEKMPQDWDRDELIQWAQARERIERVVRVKMNEDGGVEIWAAGLED